MIVVHYKTGRTRFVHERGWYYSGFYDKHYYQIHHHARFWNLFDCGWEVYTQCAGCLEWFSPLSEKFESFFPQFLYFKLKNVDNVCFQCKKMKKGQLSIYQELKAVKGDLSSHKQCNGKLEIVDKT